jgi:hypothetical protein
MMTTKARLTLTAAALALLATDGCISGAFVASRVGLDTARTVRHAAKAQLLDGSIVTFPDGARIDSGRLIGDGWRFGATFRDSVRVSGVSVDSVATLVAFRMVYDPAKSVGMTVAGAVAGFLVALAALYGLCAATECFR